MADLIDLSQQSPSSLSPWEPSVLLQLWNPDVQAWSCLGWTRAERRCRRVLSQAKREATMRILPDLGLSGSHDVDFETELLGELSHECLCRYHSDDETAKTLVEQWKTALKKARSQYQKTERTTSKESLSTDSVAHHARTQSPPLSSTESEETTEVMLKDHPEDSTVLKQEAIVEQTIEQSTSASSPRLNSTESASPPAGKTPPKLGFSTPVPGATPSKSPEVSKSTPLFDFTQLFQTPGSHKPTVNPHKGTPAPAAFKYDQSRTPGTSSTADMSHSSVASLSPNENTPAFVFTSSSTPSRPPATTEGSLPKSEDPFRYSGSPIREAGQRIIKSLREIGDMEVPNELDGDISGLGQSIERLRLRLEKGRSLCLSGPDAGSEGDDETSDQDGKRRME